MDILVSFSLAVIKYHSKVNFRENSFLLAHNSTIQSIVGGKSRQYGLESSWYHHTGN